MIADPASYRDHVVRFGAQELAARSRAKRFDHAFAAEVRNAATAAREALAPSDPAFKARLTELEALIRAARRALGLH